MPIPTYFIFKQTDSRDMGVVVINYPPFSIPAEKASTIEIPGRSGSLTLLEGDDVYKNRTVSVDCFIENADGISNVAGWLRGSGELIFGNSPNRMHKARVTNQIDFTKAVRGNDVRLFSVGFLCDPFQYEAEPRSATLYSPTTIKNESVIAANPTIRIFATGDVTFSIGSISVTLTGITESVTIDCDAKLAYTTPGSNIAITLNEEVWPVLASGDNFISWTGSVSKVEIFPNLRWLL
ncbi:MAG: phage tail family protein [Clostridia bacterium]|nr:phage tail family protein [Clostridia bacterium]